jgi:membrane protease subunit HflC
MRKIITILIVLAVLVLLRLSFYTVDASEYVYVTVLGRHVATYDGAAGGAGLHLGWPWPVQMVQRIDRRLQAFDLPAVELLTPDAQQKAIDKNLSVEAYVCWLIADPADVEKFIQSMGTVERAQTLLRQSLNSQLGAAIGQMRMDDIISTRPGVAEGRTRVDDKMDELQQRLLAVLQKPVRDKYGIELVDLRLRRFYHPTEVRNAIFERIRSERNRKVQEHRSQGERDARKIESDAEQLAQKLEEEARFEEKRLKGEADVQAAYHTNQAYAKDPQFYALLKSLENLEKLLADNRPLLLLSTKHPLFELLLQTPRTPPMPSGNSNPPALSPNNSKKKDEPKKGGA